MSAIAAQLCYAGCGTAWAACYTAAGLVAGTIVSGPLAPAAAMVCNAAESVCMSTCFSISLNTVVAESFVNPTALGVAITGFVAAIVAMLNKHNGPGPNNNKKSKL